MDKVDYTDLIYSSFPLESNCFLFTFKGDLPQYQSINYVDRLVKKISSTYFIVRERNKAMEGYHFHAIFQSPAYPKRQWFKKGVHMNVQKITKYYPRQTVIERSKLALEEQYFAAEAGTLDDYKARIEDGAVSALVSNVVNRRERRDIHKLRVVKYLLKELPSPPYEYNDYIFCVRRKYQQLQ